jgi:hypothetical protein
MLMGRVNGVKEKLHFPLYDAVHVPANEWLGDVMTDLGDPQALHFFVNLNNKTKIETNLQQAGRLPSQNAFEVRALRIVASPPGPLPAPVPAGGPPAAAPRQPFFEDLAFQSVTSLFIGEKIMIEAPTCYFPSGAGVGYAANSGNGVPDPTATFRFAEPVAIDPHQSFRVDLTFPRQTPPNIQNAYGDMRIWCVLDGYMTRDVQ